MNSELTTEDIINVTDLIDKEKAEDSDIIIIEDSENTKQITIINLRKSMIMDDQNPSTDRLWSSEKINKILTEVQNTVEKSLGSMNKRVDEVENGSASVLYVDTKVLELDKKKANTDIIDTLSEELENKLPINATFTSKSFKCTTDDEKLHLEHLGKDILSAMTGGTPVNPATTPTGGWQTEDLCDGIIIASKLGSAYRFKKNVTDGSMNIITDDGLYLVGSDVVGVPKYEPDETDPKLLEVKRFGEDGKYICQTVYYFDQVDSTVKRPYKFERIGEVAKIHTLEFSSHFEVTDTNKVESDLLGDTYNNRGIVTSGSVYDIVSNGNYLCTSGVSNLPLENTNFLVTINTYNETVEFVAKTMEVTGGSKEYVSFIYYDSAHLPVIIPWFSTATNLKSKFDGKRVHVFGDGIAYGVGASSINDTSLTALLSSKYGYTIYNHSLPDATYGIYDNDNYKDKCVLTQAQLATGISDGDYVIIFAGTNDFTSGVADIGTNLSTGTTTFKGSITETISTLLNTNPNLKILLVSPIYRDSINSGDGHNSDDTKINDKYLSEFADAIVEIGKYYHIPTVNLYDEGMINKFTKGVYLNDNGIYPTDAGYELLCEKIHDAMCRYY